MPVSEKPRRKRVGAHGADHVHAWKLHTPYNPMRPRYECSSCGKIRGDA